MLDLSGLQHVTFVVFGWKVKDCSKNASILESSLTRETFGQNTVIKLRSGNNSKGTFPNGRSRRGLVAFGNLGQFLPSPSEGLGPGLYIYIFLCLSVCVSVCASVCLSPLFCERVKM